MTCNMGNKPIRLNSSVTFENIIWYAKSIKFDCQRLNDNRKVMNFKMLLENNEHPSCLLRHLKQKGTQNSPVDLEIFNATLLPEREKSSE